MDTDQLVVVELRPLLVHREPPGGSTDRRAPDVHCKHTRPLSATRGTNTPANHNRWEVT